MTFIAPLTGLLAAAIVIPSLLVLYFLKLKRKRMVVSSTLLWKKAVQDLQVNSPFQKLRKNLLLLLQLLILAGLLLALARPTLQGTGEPGDRVVIVLDHSASMRATDVSPDRLSAAKDEALRLIDGINDSKAGSAISGGTAISGGGAMVVSYAHRARVLQPFSTDRSLLRRAVMELQPTDQPGRLSEAMKLIEPYLLSDTNNGKASPLTVYVISDGKSADDSLPALDGATLHYVKIGESAAEQIDNLAITSLSVRRDWTKPLRVQVFAQLANHSAVHRKTTVRLSLDGQVRSSSVVEVPPAVPGTGEPGQKSLQFDLVMPAGALVELAHDHDDQLASDNQAWMVLSPPQRLRVLLVSKGNAFLDRAIRAAGVRQLVVMDERKYETQLPESLKRSTRSDEGFDLIVFDGISPTQLPPVNSLWFAAQPPLSSVKLITPQQDSPNTAQRLLDWQRDHPLLRHVSFDDVVVQGMNRLAVSGQTQVLATAQNGPVLAAEQVQGVQHVIAAFDPLRSNWPMQISFPVFVDNAMQWLGLGSLDHAGQSYQPGDVVIVSSLQAERSELAYEGPQRLRGQVEGGRAVLPMFEQVGVYSSSQVSEPMNRLAVSLLEPLESDIRAAEQLQVNSQAMVQQVSPTTIRREVWPWFVLAALGILMLEWLVYTRRMSW